MRFSTITFIATAIACVAGAPINPRTNPSKSSSSAGNSNAFGSLATGAETTHDAALVKASEEKLKQKIADIKAKEYELESGNEAQKDHIRRELEKDALEMQEILKYWGKPDTKVQVDKHVLKREEKEEV